MRTASVYSTELMVYANRMLYLDIKQENKWVSGQDLHNYKLSRKCIDCYTQYPS
jgi:hypothetical protein